LSKVSNHLRRLKSNKSIRDMYAQNKTLNQNAAVANNGNDRFAFLRKNNNRSNNSRGFNNNFNQMNNRFANFGINNSYNGFNNGNIYQHSTAHQQPLPAVAPKNNAAETAAEESQEAKPGNKRAILVDLPGYLYSIPALASFFEPYGEVAMLQVLPQKRIWDGDLIDILGASMCTRLSRKSLCAVVEFHSARMAKFIIGILRKRLPTLKFRCALLKPSAAIELTNQADSLGLTNAVRVKSKTSNSSGSETGLNSTSSDSNNSDHQPASSNHSQSVSEHFGSEEESGMEEMSQTASSNNRNNSQSRPTSTDSDDLSSSVEDNKKFVSSFKIVLN
jgi:hypothetical protein